MNLPETIPFFDDLPLRIHIINLENTPSHRHIAYEIIFVLDGCLTIITEGQRIVLKTEDVYLVNSLSPHEIITEGCRILHLHFDYEDIRFVEHNQNIYFDVNSSGNTHSPKFDFIRHLLAQFIKVNMGIAKRYKTLSLLYALIDELNDNFRILSTQSAVSKKYKERLSDILNYIDEHYKECLTLNDLSKQHNLSVPYLSSFFEKNIGQTFHNYYNEIRLRHAMNALLASDESIENIALNNGFRDSRAFVALFKKKYKCLPSVYRKQILQNTNSIYKSNKIEVSSFDENNSDTLILGKYLNLKNNDHNASISSSSKSKIIDAGNVAIDTPGITLTHKYKTFCCVGSAKQFLYKEVQDMIRTAQQDIGYTYVKFHGIFSDDMMVYTENAQGQPVYSFVLVDKVLDFLKEIHLKPLIQLSFMPVQLASDPEKMIDMNHFNTSPPKDMQKWVELVQALIKHIIKRYGIDEARSWLYCVWNEPDTPDDLFGWSDAELFYAFYASTYHAVKAIDANLLFGTPSLLLTPQRYTEWPGLFIEYCLKHDCMGDFLNVHYYDNAFEKTKTMMNQGNMSTSVALNTDEYAFTIFINSLKYQIKKWNIPNIPIYMTEWNLTVSHRDLINDTCFKSCYIMKSILDNYDRLDSYGYWCLTDFHEELQLPENLFHGGLGLFTYNGVPKANYNIFKFLTKLGNEMIAKGNGYFITKSPYKVVLILYNYEHYSKLTRSFDIMTDITLKNAFSQQTLAYFSVTLEHIPSETCLIKELFVNDTQGSSFEAWLKMGAQNMDSPEYIEYLRQSSYPGLYLHREEITDGKLTIQTQLAPYEVRILEVTYD